MVSPVKVVFHLVFFSSLYIFVADMLVFLLDGRDAHWSDNKEDLLLSICTHDNQKSVVVDGFLFFDYVPLGLEVLYCYLCSRLWRNAH